MKRTLQLCVYLTMTPLGIWLILCFAAYCLLGEGATPDWAFYLALALSTILYCFLLDPFGFADTVDKADNAEKRLWEQKRDIAELRENATRMKKELDTAKRELSKAEARIEELKKSRTKCYWVIPGNRGRGQ